MKKTLKAKTILKFLKKNKRKKFNVGDSSNCPACQCLNEKLNGRKVRMFGHTEILPAYRDKTGKRVLQNPYDKVSKKWAQFTRNVSLSTTLSIYLSGKDLIKLWKKGIPKK